MVAVIDTFAFNGEPIVELRLKYLYPHVTEFVIVEARHTHTGKPKPELYCEKYAHIFFPYQDKIKFLIIDAFPDGSNSLEQWLAERSASGAITSYIRPDTTVHWFRENYQRNFAHQYLRDKYGSISQDYIVMVCDVDEIPSAEIVKALPSRYFGLEMPTRLEMKFFYYNFGWKKPSQWYHAFCINDKGASTGTFSDMRMGTSGIYIPNAGWHASYFMSKAGMASKIESIAHGENDVPGFKDMSYIQNCIAQGKDLFARGPSEDLEPFDISFLPKPFQDFNTKLVFLQTYA
jgi:beta-1,4-mannosyl-glycoprotein beta-1,4-N-acetylglucosaminyltransferase